ncbi:MAG: PAS domain-containing protein [Sphingobacteriaceae bacterium]|nr:PAS domain-containing protein [Sphingobacteriaceae bacterium]
MAAKVHKENQFSPNPLDSGPKKEAVDQGIGQHVDALQLQWLRLNSLFQHNAEGMAMTDDFGNMLMANQSFCKILNKSQEEVLEMRVQDLLPIKGLQEITAKAHLQAIARQGHYVIGTKIRDRRYLGVRHVVMEESNDQHHVLLYVTELTEKIQEQTKQAEKEELLLQVLENSQEPFLLLDTALTITTFNPMGAELLHQSSGRKAEKGASILDYGKSEQQKERSWKLFREVLSGIIVEREMKFTPLGTAFQSIYKITYLPFFDGEGKIYGIYISGRDITNRLTDAQTIAEKQVFQEVLQHGAHGAMLILTPGLTIRYATPAVQKLLGYDANTMTGQHLAEYLQTPKIEELRLLWQDLSLKNLAEIEGLLVFVDREERLKQLRYTIYDYQQVPVVQGYVLQLSDASDLQVCKNEIRLLTHVLERKTLYKASCAIVFNESGALLQRFVPATFQSQFPALVQEALVLGRLLQLLGKQPGPTVKRLKLCQILEFEAEMMSVAGIVRLLQIHLEGYLNDTGGLIYLLFMGEGAVAAEIERIAKHSSELRTSLDVVTEQHQQMQLIFSRLQEISGLLPWVYAADNKRFTFKTPRLLSPLLEAKGKNAMVLKADAIHPADARLLEALNVTPKAAITQQFELRMLNAEGLYQPYLHWASYHPSSRTWDGMWLALPSAQFSTGNPFLDLQTVWTNLGYGLVQMARFGLELRQLNGLAKGLLALPDTALGTPIEAIGVLKGTGFSKACQKVVLESGNLTVDYYHAPTLLWLKLYLFVDESQITVLIQK